VREVGDEVVDILKATDTNRRSRMTKLRGVFNRAFDVDGMARFATGRFWRDASTAQQLEYLRLFRDYVADLYANRFADYGGQSFEVVGERPLDDETIAVAGRIDQPPKPSTRVEFRVRKTSDGLKIVDVYADGLSLLITKRDEFTAVLAKNGMDGLIERLRQSRQG
jgi:phospholipid transport system substrate-binding protein